MADTGNNSWLSDMGIITPMNEIARKDVSLYVKANRGEMPQMLAKLLTADSRYKDKVYTILKEWRINPKVLIEISKNQGKKTIKMAISKAQKRATISLAPDATRSEAEIMATTPDKPVYVTIPVKKKYAMALIEHRHIYMAPTTCHACTGEITKTNIPQLRRM